MPAMMLIPTAKLTAKRGIIASLELHCYGPAGQGQKPDDPAVKQAVVLLDLPDPSLAANLAAAINRIVAVWEDEQEAAMAALAEQYDGEDRYGALGQG